MSIQRPTFPTTSKPFDVIVIGGGINGTGIARDAAERGLSVLMVEKDDFGAGTTAYSSRLIHGGLRYLEHLEFGLVLESLSERKRLLQNAPHLVRPLPFGIPIYKENKRPTWFIECGMILYDILARLTGKALVPFHRLYGKEAFLKKFPGVNAENLRGGFLYFDAQAALPERICVENAIAAKNHGAKVLNHAKVIDVLKENQQAAGIRLEDLETGEQHNAYGKVIINAAGPWVDSVLQLTEPAIPRKIGGTKGTHIIVDRFEGGPNRALYVEARQDGRPFFIIPWQKDYYLIGTTDTRYDGNLDKVVPTDDEIDYLLAETGNVFPDAGLTREKVLFSYAGVRPLLNEEGKKPGEVTRSHVIWDHGQNEGLQNVVSIIGGKITTFRNLAEETVDYVVQQFNLKTSQDCTTQNTPLPGGQGIDNINGYKQRELGSAAEKYGVSTTVVDHLIDVYGSAYSNVLALTEENPAWKNPLAAGLPDIQAQVIYAVRHELARTSADVLMRRTGTALRENVGLSAIETTARLIGRELDWEEAQIQQDIQNYRNRVISLNRPRQKQPNR